MTALNAAQRAHDLEVMTSRQLDVLVIGGGVTGAGVALDAASRGLLVGLVESDDYASGTSRWSSKMIHGGLRYLATGQFGIAMESARERHLLMTALAPHLVRPRLSLSPFLPQMSHLDNATVTAGIETADLLRRHAHTSSRLLPQPRHISARDLLASAPCLAASGAHGGVAYADGEVEDDARLVITLLRTAAHHGARIANYVAAQSIESDSAAIIDTLTGATGTIRARVVINATGVWAAGLDPRLDVVPSRGSHLVVRASTLADLSAFISLPVPGERGRFVFVKPYDADLALVGLTDDVDREADGHRPKAPAEDIAFLMDTVRTGLRLELSDDDVVGSFAGLRPLVAQAGKSAADTSRDHVVLDSSDLPISIVGGKLTTYRAMAQDTVDHACRRLGVDRHCRTAQLPLLGAAAPGVLARLPEDRRLVRRYGTLAAEVDALVANDPDLARVAVDGRPHTHAELAYAVSHEGALTADDIIERRVRLDLIDADATAARTAAASYAPAVRPA